MNKPCGFSQNHPPHRWTLPASDNISKFVCDGEVEDDSQALIAA